VATIILSCFVLFFSAGASARDIAFGEALDRLSQLYEELPSVEAALEASEMTVFSKRLGFGPSVDASASRSKESKSGIESDQMSVRASLNLFKGGADLGALNSASANLAVRERELLQTKIEAQSSAANLLIDYLLSSRQVSLLENLDELKARSLATTRLRFQRGLLPAQEVDKARVDQLNTRARLQNARSEFERVKAILTGYLGEDAPKKDWPWKRELGKKKGAVLAASNVNSRPDVQLKEFELARQEGLVDQARAEFFPRVDLSYSVGKEETAGIERDERVAMLGVSFPLYSGFSDKAALSEQKAARVRARQDLLAKKREAESMLKARTKALEIAIDSAISREETLTLSRKLYQHNFKRFEAGRVSVNDLLVDQNRLLDSESLAEEGWANAHRAWVNFCSEQGYSLTQCQTL
jgi:outer membrane protein TolC